MVNSSVFFFITNACWFTQTGIGDYSRFRIESPSIKFGLKEKGKCNCYANIYFSFIGLRYVWLKSSVLASYFSEYKWTMPERQFTAVSLKNLLDFVAIFLKMHRIFPKICLADEFHTFCQSLKLNWNVDLFCICSINKILFSRRKI